MTPEKLWRGQTLADRSSDRREQMLAVAEQLLGSGGASAVTMRAVVREANLSPRYFYESFASREDLVTDVYDRVTDQLLTEIAALPRVADRRENVRAVLEVCREFFEADPGRARILLREPLADDVLRARRAATVPGFVASVLEMTTGAHASSPERLAVVSSALAGALVALYLDYIDGRLSLTPAQLADAAVDLVSAVTRLATADDGEGSAASG
ncbi:MULTISPECIES: TetR/AcrR family transcriptional regulator [Gordonia]|uniref:TetR/AcrR family transcriptional regulator n=1 Tax=Gordonia terrae TaxID=2055 RepID=A0A2I1R294_9ACTN|nr:MULTISPECIES: TetR/AcrR family transcriptional regulator [Gordonia]PKZ63248.1 TetR/AcrR family transcriptional regulator [Gordonia terrae]UPW09569.1 TetR/AcrR family transcriptional regulator [Gordonia terrae]